jgi:hypothetical protein
MADPPPSLPTGAYITIGLLIALAALLSWLIASYPGNPSQRSGTDDCEAIAQQYNQPKRERETTGNNTPGFQNDKAAPQDTAADQAKKNIDTEGQIAKYNCQLAIYTRDLASFTKWLVYATTGLIVIGLLQGFFLQKSVHVADRAATEARDAIAAAQAGADAANAHARAAAEANRINREALIATDRPWMAVKLSIPEGGPIVFGGDEIEVKISIFMKNVGRSPATRVNYYLRLYPDLAGADQDIREMTIIHSPIAHSAGFGKILFPEEDFSEERIVTTSAIEFKNQLQRPYAQIMNGQGRPAVMASVWYNIPGDGTPRHITIASEFSNTEPGRYGFDGTEGRFAKVELVGSYLSARAT